MNSEERRQFVRDHRTCVFSYERKKGPPSMSIVYYVMDGDDLLVSTMADRAKARAVERNPQVSLCVLDESWPVTYLVVYGEARVETDPDAIVDLMMKVGELMSGEKIPDAARPGIRAMAEKEKRVVLRVTPVETFETPPKHLYAGDDGSKLQHGLGATRPWR
ncbi:MAG: PPOX class F420-dependent oxidoreductase [Deltaproteobacteria bacterium]|nr:PPOX class F420-dependent oxidoreductase [Deltaproteobacteria bacterium]MBW2416029.1 PPOX class F420-dependent oxidoreductase [Deltaproteobacteria bacterium]